MNIFKLLSKLLTMIFGSQIVLPQIENSSSSDSSDVSEISDASTSSTVSIEDIDNSSSSSVSTSNSTQSSTTGVIMANKKALCVAINNYPGSQSDLAGCINDGEDWASLLTSKFGFNSITKLKDSQATRQAVKQALVNLLTSCMAGDTAVFTYSGHGSYTTDVSGDEPDGKDETLYVYDGDILDDELRAILNQTPAGVKVTVILDSCHSGTSTRVVRPDAPKVRFMPPADYRIREMGDKLPTRKTMLSDEQMVEVVFTGCKTTEYSYDTTINGRPNGAFTRMAINALQPLSNPTYQQWYDEIRRLLPSNDYPQTPQFEGSAENKNRIVFS